MKIEVVSSLYLILPDALDKYVNNKCGALRNLYQLYNLKNVKSIHGGVLLSVK